MDKRNPARMALRRDLAANISLRKLCACVAEAKIDIRKALAFYSRSRNNYFTPHLEFQRDFESRIYF